jgi:hypothetical protein
MRERERRSRVEPVKVRRKKDIPCGGLGECALLDR